MISYYNKNISVIKETNPQLYSKINISDSDDSLLKLSINVVESRRGGKVPEVVIGDRRIYIHSKFDPVKEAKRFLIDVGAEGYDLFIVFGFGFAYHLEELLQEIGSEANVLIIEMSKWMVQKAIEYRDLTGLLNDNRVKILVDPKEDDVSEELKGKSTYRISFLVSIVITIFDIQWSINRF